ncbi:MAG: DinB family protein [Thermoanaerobaculia bacterium]
MNLTDFFAAQLEREGDRSRRALERVPEGRNDWKPHERSMPLGYLATLVAMMPSWVGMAITRDELDLNPPGAPPYRPPQMTTARALLETLDESLAAGRAALRDTTDEHLLTPWRLLVAGRVVAEDPRHVVIGDTFAHLAHHRGQLTVYLRLNGVPVPALYGPSADDKTF